MKKVVIALGYLIAVTVCFSCDDMNDIHQKYLDEGERIYLGRADSLKAFSGNGRIKLVWYATADPKVETTVIYWNLRKDSIEHPFVRTQDGLQKDSVLIDGLAEGSYSFELIGKNHLGERSLPAVIQASSYGDSYAATFRYRPITNISFTLFDPVTQSSTVKITWGTPNASCVGTKVVYKKRSTGEDTVIIVDSETSESVLTDVGNRLDEPNDLLHISSLYAPGQAIDMIETAVHPEQLACYTASGTRMEYDASNTLVASVAYDGQEKIIRKAPVAQEHVFDCNRVAETAGTTVNTNFRITLNDNQSVGITGYFNGLLNTLSNTDGESTFNPETKILTLRYKVLKPAGRYAIVEETLVPKTSPRFEIAAAKPFGDMRFTIPKDNRTELNATMTFAKAFDGIGGADNAYLPRNTVGDPTSVTFDLHEELQLTRVTLWPRVRTTATAADVYGNVNVMKFEMWGTATLADPIQPDTYWVDATDPTGTFKADWEYLGFFEVERLDQWGATTDEIVARGREGNHFALPVSAGPVRYVRFYCRDNQYTNLSYFHIGELSFWGIPQN
ncbi:MAG: hypothetical protein LBS03_03755 [Bacteroidales bacterium]|jgi:hypothetical protein|nr:hypothetical protein [Bacteroidales bacterium]